MKAVTRRLTLSVMPGAYAVCRLGPCSRILEWALRADFFSITRTPDELSIVTAGENAPDEVQCDGGWRLLKVQGPFDLSETGVLASLATPLAREGISIFALSTYDTDYIMVRDENLDTARSVLARHGHTINGRP